MSSTLRLLVRHDRPVTRKTRLGLLALGCVVAFITALDLRAGLRAPRSSSPSTQPSSSPAHPAPEVQRGLDKTPLVYPAQFVDQLVQRSRHAFVLAHAETAVGDPVGGVVLGARDVLVAAAVGTKEWTLRTVDGATRRATLRSVDPVHGLSLLTLADDATEFVSFGPAALTSGSPVVAVRPSGTVLVTQLIPAPGTEASLALRLAGSPLPPGTAVIDLDGRLVAFFAAGPAGGVPLVANDLDGAILPALRAGVAPAVAWLGADLQAIDPALVPVAGEGLAIVTWVDPGSPSAAAGLQARDTVVAARANDQALLTLEALQAALRPGLILSLDVRRSRRTRSVSVTVGRREYPAGVDAATGVAVLGGAPSLQVAPASPAAAAGLRTGDVVEAANGRQVNATELERILRAARNVVLTVRRDGHRRFVVLPTPTEGSGQGS